MKRNVSRFPTILGSDSITTLKQHFSGNVAKKVKNDPQKSAVVPSFFRVRYVSRFDDFQNLQKGGVLL